MTILDLYAADEYILESPFEKERIVEVQKLSLYNEVLHYMLRGGNLGSANRYHRIRSW